MGLTFLTTRLQDSLEKKRCRYWCACKWSSSVKTQGHLVPHGCECHWFFCWIVVTITSLHVTDSKCAAFPLIIFQFDNPVYESNDGDLYRHKNGEVEPHYTVFREAMEPDTKVSKQAKVDGPGFPFHEMWQESTADPTPEVQRHPCKLMAMSGAKCFALRHLSNAKLRYLVIWPQEWQGYSDPDIYPKIEIAEKKWNTWVHLEIQHQRNSFRFADVCNCRAEISEMCFFLAGIYSWFQVDVFPGQEVWGEEDTSSHCSIASAGGVSSGHLLYRWLVFPCPNKSQQWSVYGSWPVWRPDSKCQIRNSRVTWASMVLLIYVKSQLKSLSADKAHKIWRLLFLHPCTPRYFVLWLKICCCFQKSQNRPKWKSSLVMTCWCKIVFSCIYIAVHALTRDKEDAKERRKSWNLCVPWCKTSPSAFGSYRFILVTERGQTNLSFL